MSEPADPLRALEADVAEPLSVLIARAERRAEPPQPGHIEFNITAHIRYIPDDGPEFFRLNGVRFLAHPRQRVELAQRFVIPVPVEGVVTLWIRESASDLALFETYPAGRNPQVFRRGDQIEFAPGSITVRLRSA